MRGPAALMLISLRTDGALALSAARSVTEVRVSGTAHPHGSIIAGLGNLTGLMVGANNFTITVQAEETGGVSACVSCAH